MDVYSLAVVMSEVCMLRAPYSDSDIGSSAALMCSHVRVGGRPTIDDNAPVLKSCAEYRLLMEQCWAADPGVRPTVAGALEALRVCMAENVMA